MIKEINILWITAGLERAMLLGGQLTIESQVDSGTRLAAELSAVDTPAPQKIEIES